MKVEEKKTRERQQRASIETMKKRARDGNNQMRYSTNQKMKTKERERREKEQEKDGNKEREVWSSVHVFQQTLFQRSNMQSFSQKELFQSLIFGIW